MTELAQIRRANLGKLVEKNGLAVVAKRIGKPASQVNDMLAGRKSFGEKVARSIETAWDPDRTPGWLDGKFDSEAERHFAELLARTGWQIEKMPWEMVPTELPPEFSEENRHLLPDFLISKGDATVYVEIKSPHFLHSEDSPSLRLAREGKLVLITARSHYGMLDQLQHQLEHPGEIGEIASPKPEAPAKATAFAARPISTYESLDELPPETTILITHVDVALSAGNGRETWHIEEKEPLPFQADYIRRLDAKPKNLVAVKVHGDSMEPRLFDDDTVVVDRSDKRIPAGGGVFAIVYAGEMLVKRLFMLPDGAIRVVSDNKEKHDPFIVQPEKLEHIDVVGRIKYRSGKGDF